MGQCSVLSESMWLRILIVHIFEICNKSRNGFFKRSVRLSRLDKTTLHGHHWIIDVRIPSVHDKFRVIDFFGNVIARLFCDKNLIWNLNLILTTSKEERKTLWSCSLKERDYHHEIFKHWHNVNKKILIATHHWRIQSHPWQVIVRTHTSEM